MRIKKKPQLYLQKQVAGQIWPRAVACHLLTLVQHVAVLVGPHAAAGPCLHSGFAVRRRELSLDLGLVSPHLWGSVFPPVHGAGGRGKEQRVEALHVRPWTPPVLSFARLPPFVLKTMAC